MPLFSFAYKIGDIVTFQHRRNPGENDCCQLRGVIDSILIVRDEALYMIRSRYASHPVPETDIVRPIFSTKSFDVLYPGVEVIVTMKDGHEVPAFVENAVISNGRLRYWLNDVTGLNAFQVDEHQVRLAHEQSSNIDKFQ